MGRDTHRAARPSLRRTAAVAVLLAALVVPTIVSADPGDGPHGVLGAVPAAAPGERPTPHGGPDGGPLGAGRTGAQQPNMTWHNGPVMQSNTTHLIFWGSMPSGYESTIVQYFKDVQADSGANTNVYSTDPQYTDATGRANYSSTYGGAYDDGDAIPNHCSSQYSAGAASKMVGCVVDSDLQAAIAKAMSANPSWGSGSTNIYFVFTPPNVGSCSGGSCAYTSYCAYHWYFPQVGSASNVIYTNQPYTDPSGLGLWQGSCDSGSQPNGSWADETINVASHEHNESITDPYGTGWYEGNYNEDGDKCVWNFGTALGQTASGANYNQVINGHDYYLQQEWNNASNGCVLNTTPPPPAPVVSSFTPGSGGAGTPVQIFGSNLTGTSSVNFGGATATFHLVNDGEVDATVPAGAKTGTIAVTTPGGTATSSTAFQVPTPDFTLTVSAPQTVTRGTSSVYTVTVTGVNGFSGQVKLTTSGLPGGAGAPTVSLNPTTVNGSGTSTLTISTKSNTKTGTYNVTVTGTSGGLKHTGVATLTVQ
jgi:hypothetical protein